MWRPVCVLLATLVCAAPTAHAGIVTLSPEGTSGPGGSVVTAEITPGNASSAYLNLDFTAVAPIAITIRASDDTAIATYGASLNDTASAWTGFTVRVVAGAASFLGLNDPTDPYGSYSDQPGWAVALSPDGRILTFSGGMIAPGESLDQVLGLALSAASGPATLAFAPLVSGASVVPEASGLALSLLGLALVATRRVRRSARTFAPLLAAIASTAAPTARAAPQIAPAYQGQFTIKAAGSVGGLPTQMAFGPDGRLYVMTVDEGPLAYAYDILTGTLSAPIAAAPAIHGIGIAFHGGHMYLSAMDGSLHKLSDDNGNGVWGEPGELDVAIVTGIPQGDHDTDQLQVIGNSLYVGIGLRTINGHSGAWTGQSIDDYGGKGFGYGGIGRTWGDSAYGGTIAWIRDLRAVVDAPASANAWNTTPPTPTQDFIQHDTGPFTLQGAGRLLVHSAGTRNPFGLCVAPSHELYFTNNFNRTVTLGNGEAGFGLRGDKPDANFSRDVQDQFFKASPGADYGYTNVNWRGVNPMLTPGADGYHRVNSLTFDNLFNKGPYVLHDPASPDGLGPSSSADGCAFWSAGALPAALRGNAFIARFTATITESPGGMGRSLSYADLVAVEVKTGTVRRVASGFVHPLAVVLDPVGRLLVADFGTKQLHAIRAIRP
jgi:glucose/arabinose dehydrogenase